MQNEIIEFDNLKFEQFLRSSFFVLMNRFKKMDIGSTVLVHFELNEIEIWRLDDEFSFTILSDNYSVATEPVSILFKNIGDYQYSFDDMITAYIHI